jgi:hemoglobin
MTLYERLGGEAAIAAVVEKFYELMLDDERVKHFYEAVDLGKLKCRQK